MLTIERFFLLFSVCSLSLCLCFFSLLLLLFGFVLLEHETNIFTSSIHIRLAQCSMCWFWSTFCNFTSYDSLPFRWFFTYKSPWISRDDDAKTSKRIDLKSKWNEGRIPVEYATEERERKDMEMLHNSKLSMYLRLAEEHLQVSIEKRQYVTGTIQTAVFNYRFNANKHVIHTN